MKNEGSCRIGRSLCVVLVVGLGCGAEEFATVAQNEEPFTLGRLGPARSGSPYAQITDVGFGTRRQIVGPLTTWQTRDGRYNVEHLAGRTRDGEVLTFWWSPRADWQVASVTRDTGVRIAGPLASWTTNDGDAVVEHLAGTTVRDELIVCWWKPGRRWSAVNVSAATGARIRGAVTTWRTNDGVRVTEHVAGVNAQGDLVEFEWAPGTNWRARNLSGSSGSAFEGALTSWMTRDGNDEVEHLAGRAPDGSIRVLWRRAGGSWQSVDVTRATGSKVAGGLTSWVTRNGDGTVEHLAGVASDGSLLVFYWTPATNWRVVDVTRRTGQPAAGPPTVYQRLDGNENVEILGARGPDGSLLLYWWKPSLDWQVLNLSEVTGEKIMSDPVGWLTPDGVEHFAAEGTFSNPLVFWGHDRPRTLTDGVARRFQDVKRAQGSRKLLTILFDPKRNTDPAPSAASVDAAIYGRTNSVADYFRENSTGRFSLDRAATLGWYAAPRPASYYWGPPDPNGGFQNPHAAKWWDALTRASIDFDFSTYDTNRDGTLDPTNELAILIAIPQNGSDGVVRYPTAPGGGPAIVDGVSIPAIAEIYLGNPVNLGLAAHELSHLLFNAADMYFQFFVPTAAGDYSLMDRTRKTTHLDPFHKLKFGWLKPRLLLRGGAYLLPDIENTGEVWILMDPRRSDREYFIVENRWSGSSYDRDMSDDGGFAVWHVIEDSAIYGAMPAPPNTNPASRWSEIDALDWGRRAVQMIRPKTTEPFDDSGALWDQSTGYPLVSLDSDPTHGQLRWSDGTPSNFSLVPLTGPGTLVGAELAVP